MSLKKKYLKSKPICKVTFEVSKELADGVQSIELLGEFNNWKMNDSVALKSLKNGNFKASVNLEKGKEHEYRFIFDKKDWKNDENADKFVPTPFGVENSVVVC